MTLLLTTVVNSHKAQLGDAVKRFAEPVDADLIRHVQSGLIAYTARWPLLSRSSITLVADQRAYTAPDRMLNLAVVFWGQAQRRVNKMWEDGYPQQIPWGTVQHTSNGPELVLDFAPTATDIALCGATFEFSYHAAHVLSDTPEESTVPDHDLNRLLLAAQIQAMSELVNSNVVSPIQLSKGLGSASKETTPLAALRHLTEHWERLT